MSVFDFEGEIQFCTARSLEAALDRIEQRAAETGAPLDRAVIGRSRRGALMWGLRIGLGDRPVGVTAGAHADEPVGPITALALAHWLVDRPDGLALLNNHTFYICPQVNPDGAETNKIWFRNPIDPYAYFEHARRELPGDDVEFGYPRAGELETLDSGDGHGAREEQPPLRSENEAVARFLARGGPYVYHASLHGMAFCEGAWFLIGERWAGRSQPLRKKLVDLAVAHGFGLHDIDRHGEKGFTRIARGFCTTPTSQAMSEYFLAQGDRVTAGLFRPSSMEFIQSLGGDPLVMVSELPLMTLGAPHEWTDPPGDDTPFLRFRKALGSVRRDLVHADREPLRELMEQFALTPTPLESQIRLQGSMIIEALSFLEDPDRRE